MAPNSSNGYETEGDGIASINVTPLVDVVLVLLVIFMVTAPAIAKRGIAFQEPATVTGDAVSPTVELTIDAQSRLFYDGVLVNGTGQLKERLAREVERDTEVKALISVDRSVPHGEVMALLDAAKLAGVRQFAFTTRAAGPTPQQ